MGSGKSTVGPLVASRLGWRFLDLDDVIEAEAGCTIAQLFAREGEPAFRTRERLALARISSENSLVVALGGGAIEDQSTRALLLDTPDTLLVHLEVKLDTTLERCRGTESIRPVLADAANLALRYARRLPLYRLAPLSILADSLTPVEIADKILHAANLYPPDPSPPA